jgi:hypothetical protein
VTLARLLLKRIPNILGAPCQFQTSRILDAVDMKKTVIPEGRLNVALSRQVQVYVLEQYSL